MRSGLADLHRHLDGSLRESTLRALLARQGRALPERYRFFPGMGLAEALACFDLTLSVLQQAEAVRRVAAEICEDAALEGVTTLEVRFAPQLHRGASIEVIVDAAIEGVAGRAGLVLCGLYGEPPEVLDALVDCAATRRAVVGIDLAGGPSSGHAFSMLDYARVFRRAADVGLGRTVHAGEGRPAAEIRVAIEALGATRIGHGTTLLDDPSIVDLVIERGVTIEACPTSNVHTGVITRVEEHPIARWLARGVAATICTDNTLLSSVDLPEELRRTSAIPGMTDALLARAITCGHDAAFRR
ncbi:adenosine deaminase family protein [Myxococcota bacterium]|nr:adenosine deaminase family protein [Myxococcota bacterium]